MPYPSHNLQHERHLTAKQTLAQDPVESWPGNISHGRLAGDLATVAPNAGRHIAVGGSAILPHEPARDMAEFPGSLDATFLKDLQVSHAATCVWMTCRACGTLCCEVLWLGKAGRKVQYRPIMTAMLQPAVTGDTVLASSHK